MRRQKLIAKQQQIINMHRERIDMRELLSKMGLEKGVINEEMLKYV
jgi:hypothetical protein